MTTVAGTDVCVSRCARDADCRVDEGYTCDLAWGACVLPNATSIVPRACVAPPGPRRSAFAASRPLDTTLPPGAQYSPAVTIGLDGMPGVSIESRDLEGRARVYLPKWSIPIAGSEPSIARAGRTTYTVMTTEVAGRRRVVMMTGRDDGVTTSQGDVDTADDCVDHGCDRPRVLVVGAVVHVLYAAGDSVRVRTSRDGGATFGASAIVARGRRYDAALGRDGRLHVVSITGDATTGAFGSADRGVDYASLGAGEPMPRRAAVHRRGEMLPWAHATPAIALDARRRWIYAAYVRGGRDAVWDLVIAASKDGGATWRRTRIGDTPACAMYALPRLAVDPTTGDVHASWYDSSDGGRLAHARCTPGARGCVQMGAINDVPFAAFTLSRESGATLGDAHALIVDDARRRLHAVWTQPIDVDGVPTSRVRTAAMALRRR